MGIATAARPRPRADALRNRERIVTAAREMCVEHGSDVSLDEIARRAGVGNATLYRHFPDRIDLFRQVVLFVMARVADQVDVAIAEEPDGFAALRRASPLRTCCGRREDRCPVPDALRRLRRRGVRGCA